jgi:hypothetical protein
MKRLVLLLIGFSCLNVHAQNLAGIWRGTLHQDAGGCYPTYNIELQVESDGVNFVGRSYDYSDTSRFVKVMFTGRYNTTTKRLVIIESEVLAYNIPKDCVPCIKTYDLTYQKKESTEQLTGQWKGFQMDSRAACPPGTITLTRSSESAFKVDIIQSPEMEKLQKTLRLEPRQNEVSKALTVDVPAIKIELYDNAEIDGDTVTVLLNNKLLLFRRGLSTKPLTVMLNALPGTDYELLMYADNLGRIPPNTALMVVTAGSKKYEVYISSTEQKNAVVRFRYK